ncbi:MAG: PKD domain-containing protein [Flavobacteriia bacterium]|jgi:gliding motility-associated-like protein
MKKLIFIALNLLLSLNLWSAHIVGGDIYYDYLGNNNYRITVVLFRDCASTGAEYDDPMSVGIFNSSNVLVQEVLIPFPGSVVLPVVLNNPCVTPPANICTERAIYSQVVNLPPTPGGYNVSYQRCCRGPNVTNLISPEDTGLTLVTHITGTNSNAIINSSPRFNNYPPLVICNNDILNFDHSATDPDGDQLVYELITPFAGATDVDPMPQPPPSPPYFQVNFAGGYAPINPLGPGATISIDPVTGQLIADPELLGLFVVGIRVKEYRNGVLIGQSDRDFLFKVVNCVIQLQAEVVPQVEASNFISFCQGYDAQFENNSFGGTNYLWDFGVDSLTNDVSTAFEPNYTFPGPGEYEVTLVVNPGWPCTDTSTQLFIIQEGLDVSFTTIDSICVTGNSFDFVGFYDGPANPTITWDFGPHANFPSANTLNVNNVVFDTSGYIPVTIYVETGQCEGSFTDMVFLYDEPKINFGIDPELKCAPYEAFFLDSSSSYAPLIYSWNFGDGTTSDEANPSHVYLNPGIYDVTFSIQSTEGCISTLTMTKDDLIRVYPSPIADFNISPDKQTVFEPFFTVEDKSFDSDVIFYIYNDSLYTFDRNPSFSFVESGNHRVTQVVQNEFGCRDTIYKIVSVIPQTTVFIPNTFTPDGNNFNNVFIPIIYDVLNYEFWVYNRWGEEIFYSTTLREGWDGTYKGRNCQDGIYTYKVKFSDIQSNDIEILTGHITLLR